MRYLPKIGGSSVVVLNAAEYADLTAHDVEVGLYYEARDAGRMLGGAPAGVEDATWALARAKEIIGFAPRTINFTADFDVTSVAQLRDPALRDEPPRPMTLMQQQAVDEYLDGATSVLGVMSDGRRRAWVYGEFSVIEHCVSTGKAGGGVQTVAWSGGQVSRYAALYQTGQQIVVNGVSCDVNMVRLSDWGQLGDNMPFDDADKAFLTTLFTDHRKWLSVVLGLDKLPDGEPKLFVGVLARFAGYLGGAGNRLFATGSPTPLPTTTHLDLVVQAVADAVAEVHGAQVNNQAVMLATLAALRLTTDLSQEDVERVAAAAGFDYPRVEAMIEHVVTTVRATTLTWPTDPPTPTP
jgi:hypothetical protein